MPRRRKAQELSEIGHVKLQQCHDDSWLKNTVVTSKLQKSSGLLDEDTLLRIILLRQLLIIVNLASRALPAADEAGSIASTATWLALCWQTLLLGRIDVLYLVEKLIVLAVLVLL
tara:strand:+ start:1198 stop:1542 length:345 start_codon:yes stop_codon:yes gene_type:complete